MEMLHCREGGPRKDVIMSQRVISHKNDAVTELNITARIFHPTSS